MTRDDWRQRTFHILGCRVLIRRTGRDGRNYRVKVTDPGARLELEQYVMALVAGKLAEAHVAHGVPFSIGVPTVVEDHEHVAADHEHVAAEDGV